MITINLVKPGKGKTISYQAEVLHREPGYVLALARWDQPAIDLGYVTFETDDLFYEHYYADRWYNIFELHSPDGTLKGWYCNVTRPAVIAEDVVISEDLELDLFVPPDRASPLRLDVDEFEARGFAESDRATYDAALAAFDELERMARAGDTPFGPASG